MKLSTKNQLSKYHYLNLFFIFILFNLSSCAILTHKTPTQKTIQTGLKTVHTLDIYAEKNTIHALFSGIDSNTQQLALKYMRTADTMGTWSETVTVNKGLMPVNKSKRGNDFQVAAYGNKVMAVWQTIGREPWTGKIAIALSRDFGQTWQQIASPVSEKYAAIDQGYFDLTADNLGQFHIVWLDDREEAGNTQGLRYARFSDKQTGLWEHQKTLEMTACTCCWASITSDKNNNIHILYRDDNPRDMMLVSSLDAGQSWQKPKTAGSFGWEFVGCPHQGGGLTITQPGKNTLLHNVIWNGKNSNRGIYYSQSVLNSDKIAIPQKMADNNSASGDIASLNNEHLRIIYTSGDFESTSVMTRASYDGGLSWSEQQQLTSGGAEPSHPRIIATSDGFRFFWTEWQENGDAVAIISEFE